MFVNIGSAIVYIMFVPDKEGLYTPQKKYNTQAALCIIKHYHVKRSFYTSKENYYYTQCSDIYLAIIKQYKTDSTSIS